MLDAVPNLHASRAVDLEARSVGGVHGQIQHRHADLPWFAQPLDVLNIAI